MTEQLWGSDPSGSTVKSATFTRPNDPTAYTAGDVVGTNLATIMTFEECARVDGLGGLITRSRIIDGANQATKPSAELWLFSIAPAAVADNAAFAPTDTELNSLIGIIPISNSYVGKSDAGAAGNAILQSDVFSTAFHCEAGARSIYGVLVARNAYTPVAQETFRVQIEILQG